MDIGDENKAKKPGVRDEDIDEQEPQDNSNKARADEESEDEAVVSLTILFIPH